jgi:hypothetical protein
MARLGRPPVDPRLRFWQRVRKAPGDGCWVWTGNTDKDGYGVIVVGSDRNVGAHRFSFEAHVRRLAPGEVVRHRCDNPPCVRPDHLLAGTVAENNADARARGRARARARTVTPTQAALAERFIKLGANAKDVARRLGVSRWSLDRAIRRRKGAS